MHYHAEVYLRELNDVESQVAEIMNPHKEDFDRENYKGFWDWYVIGGRWNGTKEEGYNPYEDPAHLEICWLCQGTGMRNDELGKQARENDPEYTCNGCRGTGKKPSFEAHWSPHKTDIMHVSDIPDELNCFSLIMPDCVLHKEEWDGDNWVSKNFDGMVKPLLERCRITDGYLVTVDYHC